jgi:predicted transcriptional regulator
MEMRKQGAKAKPGPDPVLKELESIKKLLLLLLLKTGAGQKDIAATLGITQPTVSKMVKAAKAGPIQVRVLAQTEKKRK